MTSILSDADSAMIGDLMMEAPIRRALDDFFRHHKETEKELARVRELLQNLISSTREVHPGQLMYELSWISPATLSEIRAALSPPPEAEPKAPGEKT